MDHSPLPTRSSPSHRRLPTRCLLLALGPGFFAVTGCADLEGDEAPADASDAAEPAEAADALFGGAEPVAVDPECEVDPACVPVPPPSEALCSSGESVPPEANGVCEVELRLKSLAFFEGQGFSEGRAEGSVNVTATNLATGDVASVREPSIGSVKMEVGTEQTLDTLIGTFTLAHGDVQQVSVCATFREHDQDVIDINGNDDVGTDCEIVTLTCPEVGETIEPAAELCKGGDCTKLRGAMSSEVQVIEADADGDCVSNECDYTPEPCDEALKGQECRASLVYFYYGDGMTTTLAQHLGTALSKAMSGYDRVVLLLDPQQIGLFNLDAAAIGLADVMMDPTEANFFASLQDLTARGCDIDTWLFSHGSPVLTAQSDLSLAVTGGRIEALEDDDTTENHEPDITTKELLADTAPEVAGTESVPIRMTYGTPCFYELWNDAWLEVGAKVTSGAIDINFVPVFFGNFADAWTAGFSYSASLSGEYDPVDEAVAFAFLNVVGTNVPWLCVINTVLGKNSCAEDFFIDSDLMLHVLADGDFDNGPDEAEYTIGGPLHDTIGIPYDTGKSGVANMRASSQKVLLGNGAIRKNVPATLSWP